jgi:hypothetical protein
MTLSPADSDDEVAVAVATTTVGWGVVFQCRCGCTNERVRAGTIAVHTDVRNTRVIVGAGAECTAVGPCGTGLLTIAAGPECGSLLVADLAGLVRLRAAHHPRVVCARRTTRGWWQVGVWDGGDGAYLCVRCGMSACVDRCDGASRWGELTPSGGLRKSRELRLSSVVTKYLAAAAADCPRANDVLWRLRGDVLRSRLMALV